MDKNKLSKEDQEIFDLAIRIVDSPAMRKWYEDSLEKAITIEPSKPKNDDK